LLKKFYYEYHLHILKEDKQLYTNLLLKFTYVEDKRKVVEERQKEMEGITAFIEDFALKTLSSVEHGVSGLDVEEFNKKLQFLGDALTKRVQFEEEELYELYNFGQVKETKNSNNKESDS